MLGSSSPPSSQRKRPEYKVVIAYDFGTTYSGAAYAFTHTAPEVFDVVQWPHKAGNYFPKVPTLSLYSSQDAAHLREWGYGAKKAMLKPHAAKLNVQLSNFKLWLSSEHEGETAIPPLQAVADYLRELHEHTLKEITRGFAKNYDVDSFRYCLTVPAVWSDKAKNIMRQAAVLAGLISRHDPSDRLLLISEPEAAAIYCRESLADQVQIKPGDRLMVCDAGGGTVDLIVLEQMQEDRMREATQGVGACCGSVYLDMRYRELLEEKVGKETLANTPAREINDLMDQFIDTIKPEFDGIDDHYVTLPRSITIEPQEEYLDEGTLKLSADELKAKVFDPIIDQVLALIEKQIPADGKPVDSLFLVGGFGASNYLYQRVSEAFSERVGQILCPAERAPLAVVRGAVYYGLHPHTVSARVSKRTYGINAGLPFDESRDPPATRVVRPDGSVRCTTRFLVFVRKHDTLPVDHCIREEMFVYYGTIKRTDIMLYATENETVPRYFNEPGVQHVAAVSVPIPEIPNIAHGQRISYTVRMYFGSTEIRMEADFGTGQTYTVYCDFDASDIEHKN